MTSRGGRIMLEMLYEISNVILWGVFLIHVITNVYYAIKLEKIKKVKKWKKVILAGMISTISIIITNFILGLIIQKYELIDMIYVCLTSVACIMIYISETDMSNMITKN